MKKIYSAAIIFIFVFSVTHRAEGQVVINEFSSSNLSQYVDNHQDYEDWAELYNISATTASMAGYYLSDDSLNNLKWQIPAGININGNGFLRFWLSGRNEIAAPNYHTNFKLTQTKNTAEHLVLSDPSGTRIDLLKLNSSNRTQLGHSRGRQPNGNTGANAWKIFSTPTPNSSNNASAAYIAYGARPSFDLAAGFYTGSVTVTITNNEPSSSVYYTLSGSLPSATSTLYTGPITISSTSVLKAIAISTNPQIRSSFIEFSTYFINVSHTMSVVSIAATSLTTLANGSGSTTPVGSCEYFDTNGVRKAKTYGGFNRHGQDSWVLSQRSLDFMSRDEMGYNYTLKEQLFPQTPRDEYQEIIFRAAGDDNFPADYRPANQGSAHMRDAYIHMLAKNGGMALDVRLSVKTIVYINGQYWGVYDIRDNPDDHDNTKYYYGQDKFNLQFIETWGNTWAEYGGTQSITDWNTLRSYIINNPMTNQANFDYVASQLDITSLVDYIVVNSFTVCTDWLNYNTGWWRGMDTTGTHRKWGYILWDNDATFDHYINYTGVPSTQYNAPPCNPQTMTASYSDPQQHLTVLNRLLTNTNFRTWFINHQIDLWNTVFSCNNMLTQFDSIVAVLTPEMQAHCTRWSGHMNIWQTNVQTLRTFISNRCNFLSTGFINCYNLTGPYNIVFNTDPPNSGTLQLNSLTLTQLPWTGTYFGNIATSITANPGPGYAFNQWMSASQIMNPNQLTAAVTTTLTSSDSITARFDFITAIGNYVGDKNSVSVYPTAFSGETTIEYTLTERAPVSIQLMSMLGAEVAQINTPEEFLSRGNYSVKLNLAGSGLGGGVYLLKFTAGDYSKTIKLVYSPG